MIKRIYMLAMCLLLMYSCRMDDCYRVLAEDERWQITLNEMELFAFDKESKSEIPLLKLYTDHCVYGSASDSVSALVHKDSLFVVSKAHILSYPHEPLTLLLQDVSNYTVCHSFVFQLGVDSLIHLPSSGDFLGVSWDDCLIIMDSYNYNEDGRYGIVQGYTFDGVKVCEMKTKIKDR